MKDIDFFRHAMQHHAPMQDALNEATTKNWREANNNWGRAITAEAGELQKHLGWEWWKSKRIDREQAFLEIVDIYHFWLSAAIHHDLGSEIRKYEKESSWWDLTQKRAHTGNLLSVIDFLIMEASGLALSTEKDNNKSAHTSPMSHIINIGHAMLSITRLLSRKPEDILTWYIGRPTLTGLTYDYRTVKKEAGTP